MKIYTITKIQSNVCEVETKAFIDYDKALIYWTILYREHVVYAQEYFEHVNEDKTQDEPIEETFEDYTTSKENKHFSYDDGEVFTALDLDTHEVEE